jgi:hypothetical protein
MILLTQDTCKSDETDLAAVADKAKIDCERDDTIQAYLVICHLIEYPLCSLHSHYTHIKSSPQSTKLDRSPFVTSLLSHYTHIISLLQSTVQYFIYTMRTCDLEGDRMQLDRPHKTSRPIQKSTSKNSYELELARL